MKLMCQISRLLQRWCFCYRDRQTHWCRVEGKQTWNIKALWAYLELEQDAFMKLSAVLELVFVMIPVLKKKRWTVQEQLSCLSWCWHQEHRLYWLVPHLPLSELQSSHVVLDFLCWRCLQLHPGNRTTVNQSTCVCNIEEVLERWVTWLAFDSDGLGEAGTGFLMTRLVIIFLFLVKTRGGNNCRSLSSFGSRLK